MVLVTKWLEEGGFTFPPVQRRRGCCDGDAASGFGGRIGVVPGCSEGCEKAKKSWLETLAFCWRFRAFSASVSPWRFAPKISPATPIG